MRALALSAVHLRPAGPPFARSGRCDCARGPAGLCAACRTCVARDAATSGVRHELRTVGCHRRYRVPAAVVRPLSCLLGLLPALPASAEVTGRSWVCAQSQVRSRLLLRVGYRHARAQQPVLAGPAPAVVGACPRWRRRSWKDAGRPACLVSDACITSLGNRADEPACGAERGAGAGGAPWCAHGAPVLQRLILAYVACTRAQSALLWHPSFSQRLWPWRAAIATSLVSAWMLTSSRVALSTLLGIVTVMLMVPPLIALSYIIVELVSVECKQRPHT